MSPLDHVRQAWARFGDLLRVVQDDRVLRRFVLVLFAIDLAWILWFVVARLTYDLEITRYLYKGFKQFRITTEGGYPEQFNYLQTLLLVLLLARLSWSHRKLIYVALTILFTVVLLDDYWAIHEGFGRYLVWRFQIPKAYGLRAQDFGELITWSILGAFLVPLLAAGLIRARPPHRANGMAMLVPFAALLFFAVVVDQLYGSFGYAFLGATVILDSVEDGGEMLAITTCFAVAAALVKHGPGVARPPGAAVPDRRAGGKG